MTTAAALDRPRTITGRQWLLTVGALLLAGPFLFNLGYALHPLLPMDAAAAVTEVADVRTRHAAAKVLVAVGCLLTIALILTYRQYLTPGRGRAVATVGAGLVGVGMVFNALSQATHGYLLYWASAPGVERGAGVAVVEAAESSTGWVTLPVSFFSVPVFAVGMLLVAVALWRAGTVPRWVPIAMVLAGIVGGAVGAGPVMLAVLVLDVAAAATALVYVSKRVEAVAP